MKERAKGWRNSHVPDWVAAGVLVGMLLVLVAPFVDAMGSRVNNMDRPAVVVTKADDGKTIAVKTGDIVELLLSGPGATGFEWRLEPLSGLEEVSRETRATREGGLVGAPVTYVWRLKAEKPGTAEVKALYFREWEGKDKAVDRFSLTVVID